jgi:hypothetical protein
MPKKVFLFGSYNPFSYQPETTAYLTAIAVPNDSTVYYASTAQQIIGSAIWTALDTFVVSLKNAFSLTLGVNNLSTKFNAIYPMIGGTATSHKYNLVNPLDTNAAFRLTFSGGWTHAGTGALPNGSNGYADTYIVPNTNIADRNNCHISYYSRTNKAGSAYVEMGVNTPDALFIAPRYDASGAYRAVNSTQVGPTANSINTAAFFQANRISSSQAILYRNSSALYTDTVFSSGLSTRNIFIGCYNNAGSPLYYTNRECSFASAGIGMNGTEQTNYYNAIQTLQTSLFRQV